VERIRRQHCVPRRQKRDVLGSFKNLISRIVLESKTEAGYNVLLHHSFVLRLLN
jgi:hypothetical protein